MSSGCLRTKTVLEVLELENARLLEELAALRAEKVRAEEALRAEAADLRERILDLEAEVILFLNTTESSINILDFCFISRSFQRNSGTIKRS